MLSRFGSSLFFLGGGGEGSAFIVSVRARSGCWVLSWARFGSSSVLKEPILTGSVVAHPGSWMFLSARFQIFLGRVPPFWHITVFHVFYNSNPITMFPCAPFSDIQDMKREFPNLYFPAIVNHLHLYLFRPVADLRWGKMGNCPRPLNGNLWASVGKVGGLFGLPKRNPDLSRNICFIGVSFSVGKCVGKWQNTSGFLPQALQLRICTIPWGTFEVEKLSHAGTWTGK